ncbi:MAG: ferredoxin reductase family protein, partial [Pseudonocardiaceae bacterium]
MAAQAVAVADSLVRPASSSRIWAGGLSASAMLTLVAVMVWGDPPSSRAQTDSTMWWDVARASGLMAWALLGASVAGGLLLATRLIRGRTRTWILGLHEFVGVLAVVFTAIHLASVFACAQLRIGLLQLLVPFTRSNNPVAQGCAVLALYLITAVVLTSWARALLSWRWWRRLHLLAFPLFGLACAHAVLAGTDITQPILRSTVDGVGVTLLFLAAFRLASRRAGKPAVVPAGPPELAIPTPLAPQPQLADPASAHTTTGSGMRLLIGQTTWEADNVLSLRLSSPDGTPLPSWEPGAHIELALPSGRRRHYSLCGDPNDTRSYRIAILQVPSGRGGSVEVHT